MGVSIGKQLQGYVKIRIIGYSPERFLNLCKYKEIEIWGLEAKSDSYEMYIDVKGFRRLKPILRKTKTRIVVLERYGMPFFIHRNRKRSIFFLGSVVCIALVFLLTRYIWKIEIDGNQSITNQVILEYLEEEHVFHGMRRSDVKCDKIVTNLREKFNDIIWVSASLEGCNLVISVRENTDTFQASQKETKIGNMIASSDGVITSIVTRSGVPCVQIGDTVKKGDILVSGIIEVMNDAGEVVREEYTCADADIYAEVDLPYEEFCENVYQKKAYTKRRRKQGYIRLGNYYLGFGFQKSRAKQYEISVTENKAVCNESFYLLISYGMKQIQDYEWQEQKRSTDEMKEILYDNLNWYCKELEEEGAVVLKKQIQTIREKNGLKLKGFLRVRQQIGSWLKIS